MVATIVFMILALGIFSLTQIPFDILPVFRTAAVQVLTYFQGMPASSIETTITNRIERWVGQSPGAMEVTSKSVPGVSVVRIVFRDEVDPNAALTLANSLALGTLATLPPNTLPPVVLPYDPTGTLPLGILTVKNDRMDEARIKDLARIEVRNMLGAVKGCVAPVVVGGKDRTILIYLDPSKMEARKVSPLEVVNALKTGNMMVTPGTAYFGNNQVLLDTNMMVTEVAELNNFPIRTNPGDSVYLRDIGHAEDSYAIQTSRVRIDGKRRVYVPIYRQQGASSLAVANGVRDRIKFMKEHLPPGTELEFVMDQSFYVRQSISSLIHEGVMGAILVAIMILIFLGNWRMTFIATTSIPLAILGAVACLYVTGNTINAMTLGGLALAIGPLVDDAIVALENIHRHNRLGKTWLRAALDGSIEVMVPVMVATCTTCIVLAPVALMPGMGGFLFRPLALAVTFAMLTSFLLSRTYVPMMCATFLPEEHRHAVPSIDGEAGQAHDPRGWFSRMHHRFEHFLAHHVIRGYSHLLAFALRRRALVLMAVGALFAGSLLLTFRIGREFFPQVDAGQITIYVRAPCYLRLDATEKRIAEVEKVINEIIPSRNQGGDRETVISEIGLDPDWSAAYTANSGQQDAVVRIQLTEHRHKSAQEYAVILRKAFADRPELSDLRFALDTGGMVSTALNMGASSPIDIEVSGGSSEQAFEMAKKVRDRIADVRGAADVRVLQRRDAPYLMIDVDRQKAGSVGLKGEDVILQVVAAMNSSVAISRNFWIDVKSGNQYFLGVQYPEDAGMLIEDVLNVFATGTRQSSPVKLGSLVHITRKSGAVEINHTSQYRTYNVQVNTQGRDIDGVARDIQKRLGQLQKQTWAAWVENGHKLPKPQHRVAPVASDLLDKDGYRFPLEPDPRHPDQPNTTRVQLKGEYSRMNASTVDLAWGLAGAALLVYLLQVALFRSWAGPFVIMFTVPLGLIGVLAMLFVTRTTLNVQSQMGVIFLVGIAVNNGVLLVDFANKLRRAGQPVAQAIQGAAAIRFRPIVMTFLATFLDLIPMAVGLERGSEATIPLARAVVGGLLTSTVLTLFVVPIMYTFLIKDPLPPEADLDAELSDEPVPVPEMAVVLDDGNGKSAAETPAPMPGAHKISERNDLQS
jgi:multidrug efflux pump subunit AcrB